ncbi:hypothetical protein RJ640_008537 [Escallonia rubra]|uniref:Mitochondrial-processing peptidase subunit alpha n=1 Tax=Escallonia rubra TaxID=112253 RepID=A0AA88RQU4_9ASTE|nr:hypothetical protein RJ640_008537 [Escallonia rubra]
MYRAATSRLKSLKGRVGILGAAKYATSTTAATTKPSSSAGLFSWLIDEKSTSLPPLDFPLAGVNIPPPVPDYVEPSQTKITTLPNGVKIASETSPSPTASIGLYVDCGSIYETPKSSGATHLLERLAFKSTKNRSHLRIVREVEAIGGHVTASVSKEQMVYTYDALKTYVPEMVELLIDCVRNPLFLDWEVNEEIEKVKAEVKELSNNPEGLLLEAIHSAGFSGALANPLLARESAVDRLSSTILEEFVAENYTASRLVLAASGVGHEELLSIAEPLLSDLPCVPRPEEPKSVYVGGDYRCQADLGVCFTDSLINYACCVPVLVLELLFYLTNLVEFLWDQSTHFALAFELPGGWHNEKEATIITVLQMLMGGGNSFSTGGPGKGMHSRLYLRVLNAHSRLQAFSAFNSIYNHTGIFGIYASTDPGYVLTALDVAARELISVATAGQVDQVELDRAKAFTKSVTLMNLESKSIASEDIGRQILTYGERKPLEYFLKTLDEITPKDITDMAQKIISSPLTMASFGDGPFLLIVLEVSAWKFDRNLLCQFRICFVG